MDDPPVRARAEATGGRLRCVNGDGGIRWGTPAARWVLAATVLGSGIVFLDGTIVNVALRAIGGDLHTGVSGLQWTVDAYLVTLTALLLFGGALGDRFGRRLMFVAGLASFTIASVVCGFAPDAIVLAVSRAVQGAAGALLVPGSLAIIGSSFHDADRGRAIGAWSGLVGHRGRGRSVPRWLVDRHVLVAVGVLRERADRGRRGRDHAAPRARIAGEHRPAHRCVGRGARRARVSRRSAGR